MTEARPWRTASGTFAQDTATVAQWLAAHRANVEASEVWSSCSPGDLLTALPRHLPTDVCDVKAILGELEQFVVPGLVRWDAPGWFAWFPSNSHPHSLLPTDRPRIARWRIAHLVRRSTPFRRPTF